MKPYIGITDFTSFRQVAQMHEVFRKYKPLGSQRMLHIGVMMSHKTLNGIETKWSKVFPQKEEIEDIFYLNYPDVYYCLHYADYDHVTTATDLVRGLEYSGTRVCALQLDMPWPDPEVIETGIHKSGKQIEVILQIGKNAIEEANNDPAIVVQRLKKYTDIVHRVLLDKSMGRGLGMDAESLIPYARAIQENLPLFGIGAAGGLGPETIHLVEPLAKVFPDLSIDAQGRLRPSGSALDPIDWNMAEGYIIKAQKLFA